MIAIQIRETLTGATRHLFTRQQLKVVSGSVEIYRVLNSPDTPAGHTEMVRILIEHGAGPCLRTERGWTPAHSAAESGRLAVLRLLHSFHAPIDKEDCCGDKAARIAEIYGHHDCVVFLKKAEIECQAYRKMAAQKGISVDDTDEEWAEQGKENEDKAIRKSNIQT